MAEYLTKVDGIEPFPRDKRPDRPAYTAMSMKERVLMSPWEKWTKYRRFPWKLLTHCLLLLLSTAQILLFNSEGSAYVRAANQNWKYFFFPPGSDIDSNVDHYIFTINDTRRALLNTVYNYYHINETSVATYAHLPDRAGVLPAPFILYVTRAIEHGHHGEHKIVTNPFVLHEGDLGPLGPSQSHERLVDFFRSLISMETTIHIRDAEEGPFYQSCFDWTIRLIWSFENRGQMRMYIAHSHALDCTIAQFGQSGVSRLLWINIAVIVVAAFYLVLIVRALTRSANLYFRARNIYIEMTRIEEAAGMKLYYTDPKELSIDPTGERTKFMSRKQSPAHIPWKDIPFAVKTNFFSGWFILSLAANFLIITASLWNIGDRVVHAPTEFTHKLLEGLGCGILWIVLVGFLEHNKAFYSVVITLRLGLPRVLRFLAGVLPILLGYAFFGVACFGDHVERFKDFSSAMVTLFSVANGDSIQDMFLELMTFYPIVSQIYMYSFISLFIYVILNMFIAIMEEAFFASRRYKRPIEVFESDRMVNALACIQIGSLAQASSRAYAQKLTSMRSLLTTIKSDAASQKMSGGNLFKQILGQLEEVDSQR